MGWALWSAGGSSHHTGRRITPVSLLYHTLLFESGVHDAVPHVRTAEQDVRNPFSSSCMQLVFCHSSHLRLMMSLQCLCVT